MVDSVPKVKSKASCEGSGKRIAGVPARMALITVLLVAAYAVDISVNLAEATDSGTTDTAGVGGNDPDAPEQEPESHTRPQTAAQLGGPGSVQEQTRKDAERRRKALQRLGDWFRSKYGLTLGADYNVLPQQLSESNGPTAAAGGVARFYGHWTPFKRGNIGAGSLVFKMENRHRLGTSISPQELAPPAGIAGLTALTWSHAGGLLTNLYWTQGFTRNRFGFIAGIVDVTDYVDVYGLMNPWTDFSNLAFSTSNPTIPAPSQGLGAAVRWSITPNYYVVGGLADANGDPHDPARVFESFFGDADHFRHIEFGWIGSWEHRFSDNIHITAWQVDDRESAGIEGGWGLAFSFSRTLEKNWTPFVRAGLSDGGGAPFDRSISAGVGYQLNERDDCVGIAFHWGRPPSTSTGDHSRDQYTIEAYYRAHLLPQLTIIPDAQIVIDPAFHPTRDVVWALGIKLRVAF